MVLELWCPSLVRKSRADSQSCGGRTGLNPDLKKSQG